MGIKNTLYINNNDSDTIIVAITENAVVVKQNDIVVAVHHSDIEELIRVISSEQRNVYLAQSDNDESIVLTHDDVLDFIEILENIA